jgi:hypothetical protein
MTDPNERTVENVMTSREIDLEQALIAVIGAYRKAGGDVNKLLREAQGLIIGSSEYRKVGHEHVTKACIEIEKAVNFIK